MKNIRKFVSQTIKESFSQLKESYEYFDFDYGGQELEEIGLDEYEVSEKAHDIARNGGINILSDKNLTGVLIDTDSNEVVGGLWTSDDNDSFSFDIAIAPKYRNKGLSHILIKNAMSTYDYMNDAYMDMNDGVEMPIEVDVVNPVLAKMLEDKYGFKIKEKIETDRVIMTK